jgi:hypothetical protein
MDAPPLTNAAASTTASNPTLRDYAIVSTLLALYAGALALLARDTSPLGKESLVAPMGALVALTALVWLMMVMFRNYAALSQRASSDYYRFYDSKLLPEDWIERPARAFNNLMQLPTLFYVVCLAMMLTGRVDEGQRALAWTFVATRTLHALVYIGWNPLAYRFASWVAASICLFTLWARFLL